MNYWDDVMGRRMTEPLATPFDLLRRKTYEIFAALEDQSGPEIQDHGSWNLLQTLMKHDLVDELRLWTFPVLLGTGMRLFAEGTGPANLEVVDVMTSTTGVVVTTYRGTGAIDYGSFAFEEPDRRRGRAAPEPRRGGTRLDRGSGVVLDQLGPAVMGVNVRPFCIGRSQVHRRCPRRVAVPTWQERSGAGPSASGWSTCR